MSEADMERRIDATVESRLEVRAGYSPHINRLLHTRDAEHLAVLAADTYRPERRCRCYPLYMTRYFTIEECIANVVQHRIGCPLWVDPNPMFSRRGDTMPPSYTMRQQRQDDDAERAE